MHNLNALMIERNITQISLSLAIGKTQETISAYLNGKTKPSVKVLLELADYFNTTTDYLLDRTDINMSMDDIKPAELSTEEYEFILKYRKLSFEKKKQAQGYLDGLISK
ncbi:MAG: helix-turn-helix domain-containing protein [Christensenellales bacterium]